VTTVNYTQTSNRPFRAWAINIFFVVPQLLCTPVFIGCDDDKSSNAADGSDECSPIGETQPCDCEPGFSGTKVCLRDGTYSSCDNCYAITSKPCNDPGVEFSCTCSSGKEGTQICLADGGFTKCACSGATTAVTEAGTSVATDGGTGTAAASPCPSKFSCKPLSGAGMTGNVCVNSTGYPPFCDTQDCTSAGLSSANCMPISSYKLCIQLCE
jgi:hypothetical protein